MAGHLPAGVVLTGQQEAWAQGGGPGKYWEDKPNAGYSGTPLWKLHAERDAQQQAETQYDTVKIPDGFVKKEGDWYYSEKRQAFWNVSDRQLYVWDPLAQKRVELYEAKNYEISISAGGICHERAIQVRNVIVRDLARAAQALRMSIDHLDRPCAMYALYEGHRGRPGEANVCNDFCAKHLHAKLLPRLASFRGFWEDERLKEAMCETFRELDASFAEKHPGASEGCSAAVALVMGDRLVVASLGDVACVLCLRSGETSRLVRAHAVPDPDADEEEDSGEEDRPEGCCATSSAASTGSAVAATPPVRWTRAFGDLDFKIAGQPHEILTTPDVKILHLQHKHHGFAFICRSLYASIGGSPAVSTVFRRSAGRPRMASGALVDAAVQWLGQVGTDCSLGSIVAFFDKVEAADAPPQAKRRRTAEPSQVRLRHILVKHRECKTPIDKVRNKQVKRTQGEAERLLRAALEECEGDRERKTFAKRCRELSECQSCLKAADLAGDLGWIKRGAGKMGESFEAAAFALQVNQLSDLVDSDQGIHVILRSA